MILEDDIQARIINVSRYNRVGIQVSSGTTKLMLLLFLFGSDIFVVDLQD